MVVLHMTNAINGPFLISFCVLSFSDVENQKVADYIKNQLLQEYCDKYSQLQINSMLSHIISVHAFMSCSIQSVFIGIMNPAEEFYEIRFLKDKQ